MRELVLQIGPVSFRNLFDYMRNKAAKVSGIGISSPHASHAFFTSPRRGPGLRSRISWTSASRSFQLSFKTVDAPIEGLPFIEATQPASKIVFNSAEFLSEFSSRRRCVFPVGRPITTDPN